MRGGRRDANHKEIKRHAESLGFTVIDTADVAGGFCDMIFLKDGNVFFVEVKDGDKFPSQRKLTPAELEFKKKVEEQKCNYIIAESNNDINNLFFLTNE
jgi:hypothetical protein